MLIGAERGIKHLGNRHIAQFQRIKGGAVGPDLHRLGAFGAKRGAAAKVDAKIKAEHRKRQECQQNSRTGRAERHPLQAEKVDRCVDRNQP